MALLSATSRQRVAAVFMREFTDEPHAFSKAQLLEAVAAGDQATEDLWPQFNAALPATFRNNTSAVLRVALWAYLLWRKIGKLRTVEDG